MAIFKTQLDSKHLEKIQIFLEANKLNDTKAEIDEVISGAWIHQTIQVCCNSHDDEVQLTFMAVIHAGISNMLDDYLMKCGVQNWELDAYSLRLEKEAIRAAELERQFQEHFKTITANSKDVDNEM